MLLQRLFLGLAFVGLALADCSSSDQPYSATTFFQTVYYGLSSADGNTYSPDGTSILMTSDKSGVFNVYAQPIDGGEAIALTNSTTNSNSAISYFPNDDRILFSADEGGNELYHVYVRDDRDGEVMVQDLTPGENVRAAFSGWRDDGSAFTVLTNERNESLFDVYEYSTNDYERTLVFQNDLGLDISAVSADGRWLAIEKPRTSADSDIYLLDLQAENQTAVLITEHEGNVAHGVDAFTRDSSELIYSTNEFGEFNQAWTYDLATGNKTPLVEADWDVAFVFYSPTGRYRISGINADAQTEISIFDTENNVELGPAHPELALPQLPPGNLGQIRFSPDEGTMAFTVNSDTSPSNAFVINPLGGQDVLQLTNALSPEICEEHLVETSVVRYPSFDELDIPSILYKPHGASAENKVPALVYVHGGPGGQSTKGYDASKQHLVNHGYAILAANNRGSSGYGKTFHHMDDRRHGDVDLQDIVYGKKYLESLDWVDPDRIGIMGGSYGGYMTVAALAFEPEVFDVGIDIFGVTNWLRTLESIPPWWESYREALYDEMGDPATDSERLRSISPLFHADNIVKPLLVVQGANDPRVLQVESDEIVAALQNNSVPVEYLVFDDEGHGFRKRSNRIAASEAYVSFLEKYLTGVDEDGDTPFETASTTSGSSVVSLLSLCVWCSLLAMLNAVGM